MDSQANDRNMYINLILNSDARKKIIVAGPGTGKTQIFNKIFHNLGTGKYLVLSFIRKLVDDLAVEIGKTAEVKTFHAFCKKILHDVQGKVDIYPKLTNIIQTDSELLGLPHSEFDFKFRNLLKSSAIDFYLKRGDYYKHLSFDDSVYRLYLLLKEDNSILEDYDQIIVDEYQDFNKLEVEFLKELEAKGPILIVGDDDQAIYEGRSSSPKYLRDLFESGDFKTFDLPYCSRCPKVIVDAINVFIANITESGYLEQRIEKKYSPFTEGQEEINIQYPKIKVVTVPVLPTITKYLDVEISKISHADIIESNTSENKYPTVLIIGQKHYLSEIYKILIKKYPSLEFESKSSEETNNVLNAIRILLKDDTSNLGWRIITEELQSTLTLKSAVLASEKGLEFWEVIPDDFFDKIIEVLSLISAVIKADRNLSQSEEKIIVDTLNGFADEVINFFFPHEAKEEIKYDPKVPTILLRTFEGSKGLSGSHIFIVSANNGSIPKIESDNTIKDIEFCKFIVALTRTRKQCHIISNKWFISPKDNNGNWNEQNKRSIFLDFLPDSSIEDLGYLKAKDIY